MENQPPTKTILIKNIYLYLVCFVALMMVVISTGNIVQIILKKYVFTKADRDYYPSFDCGLMVKPMAAPVDQSFKPLSPEDCAKREAESKKQAEENRAAGRQRDLVRDISFIVVGMPLFAYHWMVVRKKE